jgi:hypothetical protein
MFLSVDSHIIDLFDTGFRFLFSICGRQASYSCYVVLFVALATHFSKTLIFTTDAAVN